MSVGKDSVVRCQKPDGSKFVDRTGDVQHRLTVNCYYGVRRTKCSTKHYWLCSCKCGKTRILISTTMLQRGQQSCGCVRSEKTVARRKTHGETTTKAVSKEYGIWRNMLNRCRNANDPAFKDYGGRGIKVCRRWLKFSNFLIDVGRCPPLKSLDRLDNDGPYSPTNCEWRTQKQQCRNRRSNHLITYNGETLCVAEWAEKIGLEYGTLLFRLRHWPVEKALTTPRLR